MNSKWHRALKSWGISEIWNIMRHTYNKKMEDHLENKRMQNNKCNCILLPANHVPKSGFIKCSRSHLLLLYCIDSPAVYNSEWSVMKAFRSTNICQAPTKCQPWNILVSKTDPTKRSALKVLSWLWEILGMVTCEHPLIQWSPRLLFYSSAHYNPGAQISQKIHYSALVQGQAFGI